MSVKKYFSPSKDHVGLEDFSLSCRVGCTPEERASPQSILLSIVIETSLEKAGRTDSIKETVNYADIMATLDARLSGQTFNLIETIAEKCADLILAHPAVTAVEVTTRKTTLPQLKSAYVKIHRVKTD